MFVCQEFSLDLSAWNFLRECVKIAKPSPLFNSPMLPNFIKRYSHLYADSNMGFLHDCALWPISTGSESSTEDGWSGSPADEISWSANRLEIELFRIYQPTQKTSFKSISENNPFGQWSWQTESRTCTNPSSFLKMSSGCPTAIRFAAKATRWPSKTSRRWREKLSNLYWE